LLLGTAALSLLILECPSTSHEPVERLVGASPLLPTPDDRLVPTLNFSTAAGWPAGRAPDAPAGFAVTRYAAGLDHPRWLYVLPNLDVLVAEASTIPREPKSISDRIQFSYQRRSGDMKASANRISLLRGAPGAPTADARAPFLSGLHQPFGMALVGRKLYVADTDALLSFDYAVGTAPVDAAPNTVLVLPAGGYNNHWTRNVIANRAGTKLYVTVGSGSDHAEDGAAQEAWRADILELNPDGSEARVFASGIRNPVGLAWGPGTETLWTVVNERDMLGNDLVPDYLTRVYDGGFYGWPYSYWGRHLDPRVRPQRADLVARAIVPDYALGAHVAALGLVFYESDRFPSRYRGGAFVAEHGSWNRKPFAGYKVVFVPFRGGEPAGPPEDFLTGFMAADKPGTAYGRPVGLAVDGSGALLVADDVGNCVWRVGAP
jgi:glucose/arabinose dehydrogenase